MFSASLACFLAALPHFIYGPGKDAINVVSSSYDTIDTTTSLKSNSSVYGLFQILFQNLFTSMQKLMSLYSVLGLSSALSLSKHLVLNMF